MLMKKITDYISNKIIYLLSIVTSVALITFISSSIESEVIYLSKSAITINLNINSPAFAALEDSQNSWTASYINRKIENLDESPLKWGENKNLWVLQNSHLIKYTKNAQRLRALTIASTDIIKKERPNGALHHPIIVPEEVTFEGIQVSSEEAHPERISVAENLLQASWAESKTELDRDLEKIIKKEKGNVHQGENSKILVSKYFPKQQASPGQISKRKNEKKEKKERSYLIRGNIVMSGGLAFTGPSDQIRIARVEENLLLDEGHVNIQEGYFEINVKELYGYIVAELTDKENNVRGYAELDLGSLNFSQINLNDITIEHEIKMKPYKEGFNIKAISGSSTFDNIVEVNLKEHEKINIQIDGLNNKLELDEKNRITSDMFTEDSNMLMRLEAKNHWGSLAIGFGQTNQKIRMYRNSLVDALISDYKESHDGYAVVWGRVIDQNGSPIAGAKVELAGDLAVGPLYFNKAHLINNQLQHTKGDGLFAFIKVLPGLQAIRATVGGEELPIELTVADNEHVSYVEVKQSLIKHITLKSFDPIKKIEVDSSVKLHGSEKIYETYSGQRNLEQWPGARGLAILESDPGQDYALTRQLINRKKNHHNVPVINTKWLNKVFKKLRLNKDSTKGIIVGFVRGDSFEVYPGRELEGWSSKDIVYFDESGRVLPKKLGRAGGGFIMYNVPETVTSISLIPGNSKKIFTQLAVTDRYFVSVMNADFSQD